jgi:predicted transcriptional regulator
MIDSQLLTGTKWELLKELSQKEGTPQELSRRLVTSLPNILHQLSILEAHGLVGKRIEKRSSPGKPATRYYIKRGIVQVILSSPALCVKMEFPFDQADMIHKVLLYLKVLNQEETFWVEKFVMINELLIRTCQAMGYYQGRSKDIELLVITENLKEVRDKISNQVITWNGKDRKIVVWSHNQYELDEGLKNNDHHFLTFKGKITPIYDPGGVLKVLMK